MERMRSLSLLLFASLASATAASSPPASSPFKLVVRAEEPVIASGHLRRVPVVKSYPLNAQAVARSRKIGRLSSNLGPGLDHALHAINARRAKPAVFRSEGGHWVARQVTGWRVDEAATRAALLKAIRAGKHQAEAVVKFTSPQRSVKLLAERGVLYHLAGGQSSYRGSPPFRVRNVLVGADKLDNTFLKPGGELNFNQQVGEISAATGFVKGFVIADGTLEKEDGGGICQVSTTLFRMAYAAGLPITERHAHSHRVEYYDPVGLEATVYAPAKNLRFKNDTAHHLFIQASWDEGAATLRFDLFGGKPDRTVKVSKPAVGNFKPPAQPSFSPDPRVRAGGRRLLDVPVQGMTSVIQRTVRLDGGKVRRDTLKSTYAPWGAVYGVAPSDARLR